MHAEHKLFLKDWILHSLATSVIIQHDFPYRAPDIACQNLKSIKDISLNPKHGNPC